MQRDSVSGCLITETNLCLLHLVALKGVLRSPTHAREVRDMARAGYRGEGAGGGMQMGAFLPHRVACGSEGRKQEDAVEAEATPKA